MSAVWKVERVNIASQCSEALLPFSFATSSDFGSSIRPNLPCGAIISAIASKCSPDSVTPKM